MAKVTEEPTDALTGAGPDESSISNNQNDSKTPWADKSLPSSQDQQQVKPIEPMPAVVKEETGERE